MMTKARTGWLLRGILCLASFPVAQDKPAFLQRAYPEPEGRTLNGLNLSHQYYLGAACTPLAVIRRLLEFLDEKLWALPAASPCDTK